MFKGFLVHLKSNALSPMFSKTGLCRRKLRIFGQQSKNTCSRNTATMSTRGCQGPRVTPRFHCTARQVIYDRLSRKSGSSSRREVPLESCANTPCCAQVPRNYSLSVPITALKTPPPSITPRKVQEGTNNEASMKYGH